jgi:hypothetical protein
VNVAQEVSIPAEGLSRETRIRRDARGRWWNDGAEITHPSLRRAFDAWIARAEDGRYCLKNDVNWAYVEIEGPPFFAARVRVEGEQLLASLSTGHEERVDVFTLREGPEGALVFDARGGTMPCALTSEAMMELADHLEEDGSGVFLRLGALRVRAAQVRDPLVPFRGAVVEARPA